MSELQAAMGLTVFNYFDYILKSRQEVVELYNSTINFKKFSTIKLRKDLEWNFSYFPIIFNSEKDLLRILKKLNAANINPRRYFYPSLNTIKYIDGQKCNISESISSRILCLLCIQE